MLASERVIAALLSDSMRPDSLTDGERAEVVSSLKAQPYNGPFSPVDVGTWLVCGMEEAGAAWEGAEAHGSPYNVIEMAKARGYAEPPLLSGPSSVTPPKVDASPFVSLYDVTGEGLPDPDPEIIEGVLRERQMMIVSAPSKAGKTWLCADAALAIATGGEWLGIGCAAEHVLYANLEVSDRSIEGRFEAVRNARGLSRDHMRGVELMNARGLLLDAESFSDMVLGHLAGRRAVVFVDTLYMLEQGDENSAGDMRQVMQQLSRLMAEGGCTLVVVHHHPKGSGGQKAAIDRMAGSGVLARIPDAIIDLSPLDVREDSEAGIELAAHGYTAHRLSFELRDFPRRRPIDLISTGKRFLPDTVGLLGGCEVSGSAAAGSLRGGSANSRRAAEERARKSELIRSILSECAAEGVDATKREVHRRYNAAAGAHGLSGVGYDAFKKWTQEGGTLPFRAVGGVLTERGDE